MCAGLISQGREIIVVGDVNTAHTELDTHRPDVCTYIYILCYMIRVCLKEKKFHGNFDASKFFSCWLDLTMDFTFLIRIPSTATCPKNENG
jgi:exonuclease III